MIIAVDTRFIGAGQDKGGNFFTTDQLLSLVENNPTDNFLFISDKPFDTALFPNTVTVLVSGPEITNKLLTQYWYNYRLPSLLRKHKAAIFLAATGICSLRTKVPQCLLVADTSFINAPSCFGGMNAAFLKKHMPAFISKAALVATRSGFSRTVLVEKYKTEKKKTALLHVYADECFVPFSLEEKEKIKDKYAQGKEYFLSFAGDNPRYNLLNLLKAFSFFKKRQKSNMHLLICGNPGEAFMNDLKTFKFREEVAILRDIPRKEKAELIASAYAVIYPVLHDDDGLAVLEAMQCAVPVVAGNIAALPETCGDAALYTNPDSFEDIAQKMMLVYKDEEMAKKMVKAGIARAKSHQKSSSLEQLRQLIKKAANG